LFSVSDRALGQVLNTETVAEEVVRTLVGSIGLVASVPITTGLAALAVSGSRDRRPRKKPAIRDEDANVPDYRVSRHEREFWEDT
jgi:hypothetical protein